MFLESRHVGLCCMSVNVNFTLCMLGNFYMISCLPLIFFSNLHFFIKFVEPNIYLSWCRSGVGVRLVPSDMFKPSSNFLTDRSKAMPLLWIIFLSVYRVCLSCCLVCSLWPCGLLLGGGGGGQGDCTFFRSHVCGVFLCFCRFRLWCPDSGVVRCLIVSVPDPCLLPYLGIIVRVSNSLDLDQTRRFVGPDLGPKCLQSYHYTRRH